ncbi:hypothetical protein BJ741DRAFT_638083 [Chytriomyces cf. hyalinus JEL632]|nr:hypothetical protein BJ741DRAFT_638083 [Chytriomyces cf. hyalinus JEL632]
MLPTATRSKSKKTTMVKTPMTEHELNERAKRILTKLQQGLNVQHSFHRVLLDAKKTLEYELEETCYSNKTEKEENPMQRKKAELEKRCICSCLEKAAPNPDNETIDDQGKNNNSEWDEEMNGDSDIGEKDKHIDELEIETSDNESDGDMDNNGAGKEVVDEKLNDKDTGDEDKSDKIIGEEITGEEITEDEIAGDEIAGDEIAEDEIAGDKIAGDEIAEDEESNDEESDDEESDDEESKKTPAQIQKANQDIAKANKFIKDAQSGKYIKTYVTKIKNLVANENSVGVIHLDYTTRVQAMTLFKEKPVVLLALNEELVGYVLTHQESRQPVQSCQFQFNTISKLLELFKIQSKPDKKMEKSHSNAFPNKVKDGSERLYNLSIFNMSGHTKTALKFSSKTWKGKLACYMDVGEKTPSCAMLGHVTEYGSSTLQTPALVDELNAIFFPGSVKRKKQIAHLINEHQKQVTSRLAENGGYLLRYIARNMLNPKHCDSKDCKVIPSTLLYGGKFQANMSFLKLSEYDISIPICVGTIISFFAASIQHEVEVEPNFLKSNKKFEERIVEVFGSYESIYQHLAQKDKIVKEAAMVKSENKKE